MQNKPHQLATRVSLIYCVLGAVWILYSDLILEALVSDPKLLGSISTFKGWAFMVATAGLLYLILSKALTRREAESFRRTRAEEKLLEQSEQYRTVVELSADAIFVMQEEKFALINTSEARLFGVETPARLLGCPVFDFIHHDYHEVIRKRIQRAQQERKPTPLLEQKFLRVDGSVVEVEATSTSIQFGGKPALLVQARDIPERRALQEPL